LLDDGVLTNTPYVVMVTASDGQGDSASQTFNWGFGAPALTASPGAVRATEGVLFTGTVATFVNANVGSDEDGTDYTATIDWGDGTSLDTGTVSGSQGSYTVQGSHQYPDTLTTYTVTVTISDEGVASKKVSTTAMVVNGSVSATGIPVNVLGGYLESRGMVPVATFTDLDSNEPSNAYSAAVAWGNQGAIVASISGFGGKYVVSSTPPNFAAGNYPVTVTIRDGANVVATATSTATFGQVYEGREAVVTVNYFRVCSKRGTRLLKAKSRVPLLEQTLKG
jgi:hypothetical protein